MGAALGFNLLLGIPLFYGGILTAIATFLILGLERYGFRPLEAVISVMVGIIAACYVIELIIGKPDWGSVFHYAFTPNFSGAESVLLAIGILGATVMPHAIFLHSALTRGRIRVKDPVRLKRLYHYEIADVFIAMVIASGAALDLMLGGTYHRHITRQMGHQSPTTSWFHLPTAGHGSRKRRKLPALIDGGTTKRGIYRTR